jgi:hypothetical protein
MNVGLRIENQYYLRMLRVVMDAQVKPLMSAFVKGEVKTFTSMSALPRKQTLSDNFGVPAKGQKRTVIPHDVRSDDVGHEPVGSR